MPDSATTHWTREQLAATHGSIAISPEDVLAATQSFTTENHRLPTIAEKRSERFHEREFETAQNRYNDAIEGAVARHPGTVDAATLKALLVQESGLDPHPRDEGRRYQGIAQLGPNEAVVDGHAIDRHDPVAAIDAAAITLQTKDRAVERLAYRTYGVPEPGERTKFTLAAYNGGEGTVAEAMRLAYADGKALAEQRGLGRDADRFARDYALHFDNLLEPSGDPSRSPLYRAAQTKLPNSDPLEKYHEIGRYADRITERAAIEPRTALEQAVPHVAAPSHEAQRATSPAHGAALPVAEPAHAHDASSSDQTLVNTRIVQAAHALEGMSTKNAQTHDTGLRDGHVACAYAVNEVLDVALGRTFGTVPVRVTSVMDELLRDGHEVPANEARPGDIAIKIKGRGEQDGHIGIVMDDGKILSNSSHRGSFDSHESAPAFTANKREASGHDQIVYLRIDPAAVDLAHVRSHPVPPREQLLDSQKTPPHLGGTWEEHRPDARALPTHAATPTPSARAAMHNAAPATDVGRPRDAAIHGETRNGKLVENAHELAEKNAVVREAIRDAKEGKMLDFHFAGTPTESAREVARQDEKLAHAIAQNLPADAKPEHVHLGWKPGMPTEEFEAAMKKARGGAPAVSHAPTTPARPVSPELGR